MNKILWFVIGFTAIVFIKISYSSGLKQSFKNFLSLLIPVILSGTAVRIGEVLLPNSINISYYIAGIGLILFYLILAPIIQKQEPDRYRKISKISRFLGIGVGVAHFWLFSSFILFFANMFVTTHLEVLKEFIPLLTLPIRFFWFFPTNM